MLKTPLSYIRRENKHASNDSEGVPTDFASIDRFTQEINE